MNWTENDKLCYQWLLEEANAKTTRRCVDVSLDGRRAITKDDVYHSLVSGFKLAYNERLLKEIQSIDFRKESGSLSVPVQFIHGRQERHLMSSLVEEYYETLDAPLGKRLLWSEQSPHAFHYIDAKKNEESMLEWLYIYEDNIL
ncbi:hypothetical protein [Paenibacillus sp. NPDC057967]|uniref:hypothetical protein n=1 Tax=Paenibacillus sp. NPDC057967 TaxID=3346293 RepID=UPI0036DD82A4